MIFTEITAFDPLSVAAAVQGVTQLMDLAHDITTCLQIC